MSRLGTLTRIAIAVVVVVVILSIPLLFGEVGFPIQAPGLSDPLQ